MAYAAVNGLNMYYEVHGDGPPLLLARLQRMWAEEPNFTREQLQSIQAPTLLVFGAGA